MAKVSVIVPIYNVEKELKRCLDSLIRQTLKDIEIICIDDGSEDDSGRILDEYASRYSQIIAIHEENGGVSKARNTGLKRAKGEWIGFVDGDDWIEDNMYETLYGEAVYNNCDIAICGCTPFNNGKKKRILTSREAEMIMFDQKEHMGGYSWSRLIRRDILSGSFYDESLRTYQDIVFFYHLFKKAERIFWHDLPLYHYEARIGSAINSYLINDKKRVGIKAIKKCADNECDIDLKNNIYSFIYFWNLEAAINYVSHYNVDSPDFNELFIEVKKTRKYMSGATLRQRLWRYIVLSKSLRRIYWKLKGIGK